MTECRDYTSASGNPAMSNVAININESAGTVEFKGEFTSPSSGTLNSVMFGILVDNIPASYIIHPVGREVMAERTYTVFLVISLTTSQL